MAQQFANQAQTFLASAYTAGDPTISVVSGAVFSPSGNFTIAMGNPVQFYLLCTGRSGNTLTVSATGQEGTAAANMAVGMTVTQVVTAASLTGLRTDAVTLAANTTGYGTYANLASRTGMTAGSRYRCSDGPYEFIYDGSVWVPTAYGYILPAMPPLSGWSWLNQNVGGSVNTVSTSNGAITLTANGGGDGVASYIRNQIASTFTITAAFTFNWSGVNDGNHWASGGLVISDRTGFILFGPMAYTGTWGIAGFKWTNATTSSAVLTGFPGSWGGIDPLPIGNPIWVRIVQTASARNYFVSQDGVNWMQITTTSNTDFLTSAVYGVHVRCSYNSGQAPSLMSSMLAFTETTP